jgi:predicted MFS family arabinose efflux permease
MTAEPTPEAGTVPGWTAAPPPLGALGLLRIGGFLVLYLNAAAVFIGVMAQAIARSWLAFQLTGSNAALGGVLLSFGVALLIATPWGGVAADRLPKRLVLQTSLLLAASSAWIGLAVLLDVIAYWMLLGAGVVQAVGFALFNPARMAFLAELVPRGSVPQAVSLLLVNTEVSRVVGPALAGAVIAAVSWGTEAVFLASAVLSTVGVLLTGALPPGHRRGEPPDRSPVGELVDGVRYVRRHPELSALTWCGIGVTMCGMPYLAFMPTISSDLFGLGSAGYGVLSATSAVGGVSAGLLLGRRSSRTGETRLFALSGGLFGVAICGLAVAPNAYVAVVVLLLLGGAMLAFQTTNQSQLLALSDMEYHGRVQGLIMLSFGAFGIAALPLGLLADVVGLRVTLAGMGAGVLLFVLLFVLVSRRRVAAATLLRDLG